MKIKSLWVFFALIILLGIARDLPAQVRTSAASGSGLSASTNRGTSTLSGFRSYSTSIGPRSVRRTSQNPLAYSGRAAGSGSTSIGRRNRQGGVASLETLLGANAKKPRARTSAGRRSSSVGRSYGFGGGASKAYGRRRTGRRSAVSSRTAGKHLFVPLAEGPGLAGRTASKGTLSRWGRTDSVLTGPSLASQRSFLTRGGILTGGIARRAR